jgi:hypothetical protein
MSKRHMQQVLLDKRASSRNPDHCGLDPSTSNYTGSLPTYFEVIENMKKGRHFSEGKLGLEM